MAQLSISLLGTFQITRDGSPVNEFDSNKVRGLLAYLAVEANRPHTREALSALLWPDWPQDSALNSLRNALAGLRRAISDREADPPYLLINRETLQFNPACGAWLDVAAFDSPSPPGRGQGEGESIENLVQSISLYRGPFLEGFSLPDSSPFEEWLILKREQLSQHALHILQTLADFYEKCADYELALVYAQRQIALEPWLEEAHRQVMRIQALSGQRSAALAQYDTCRRLLQDELGLEPSQETTRLYEAIRDDRLDDLRPGELLPAPGEPPYKGLQFFDEADAALFFGRDGLVERLTRHIQEIVAAHSNPAREAGDPSVLAVVGASGSGKSSLVRAGLVPALRQAGWKVNVITPTAHPVEAVSAFLKKTASESDRLLLVIDQFEELFTLCRDETERTAFIDQLFSPSPQSPVPLLILVLRADFYGHCAHYPILRQALARQQEYIGPMSAAELRQAVELPALHRGWEFEPGLVELILQDVGGTAGNSPEPGALPLLEHALLETWKHRQGRCLTLAGYAAAGGVRGAIAHTADGVFSQLSEQEQLLTRRIFLRLTELGEGTQDTRRRAGLSELALENGDQAIVDGLLKTLSDARLITLSHDTAEVAHEALIREWPALRQWLSEDRDSLRLHHRLSEAAQSWLRLERDPGELYRGARLAQASEWAAQPAHSSELNTLELEFLRASQELAEREIQEREALRQRELEAARKVAETEQRRASEQAAASKRLRRNARWLATALVLALLMLVTALGLARLAQTSAAQANAEADLRATAESNAEAQRQVAEEEAAQANGEANLRATAESNAEAQRDVAEKEATLAHARELAARSQSKLSTDPALSQSLALEAVAVLQDAGLPVPWAVQQSVHDVAIQNRLVWSRKGVSEAFSPWEIMFTPDGKRIVYENSSSVHVVDAANGKEVMHIPGPSNGLSISPDGRYVATSTSPAVTNLPEYGSGIWDLNTGEKLVTIPMDGLDPLFSPDGNLIAIIETSLVVYLIDLNDWYAAGSPAGVTITPSTELECLPGTGSTALAFTPDNRKLAVACENLENSQVTLVIWNLASMEIIKTILVHANSVQSIAFSPDGSRLLSGSYDKTARVWDINTGQELLRLTGFPSDIPSISYSPDGNFIAVANTTASIWDANTGMRLFDIPSKGHLYEVAFSPDGKRLVLTSQDASIQVWDVSLSGQGELATIPAGVRCITGHGPLHTALSPPDCINVQVSADKTIWLETHPDGRVVLRDTATFQEGSSLPIYPEVEGVLYASLSPDKTLLAASRGGNTGVWDLQSGKNLFHQPAAEGWQWMRDFTPMFSPDGSLLVSGGYVDRVQIWDWKNGALLSELEIPLGGLSAAEFSPDGRLLAVSGSIEWYGGGGEVWVWDLSKGSATPEKIHQLSSDARCITHLDFSPDSRSLAVGGCSGAEIKDVTTGQQAILLQGHNTDVFEMHYSSDGRYLVTGAGDSTAKVWDAQSGEELLSYSLALPGSFTMAFFTPDGRNVVAFGEDGYYHLFAFQDFEKLVEIVKGRVQEE